MRTIRSIRLRATLLICGLIAAVIAAYAATAYHQMKSTALLAAGGQLTTVSSELASMLGALAGEKQAESEAIARDPAVGAYLLEPGAGDGEAILDLLRPRDDDDEEAVIGTELRDTSGRRVIATEGALPGRPGRLDAELARLVEGPDTTGVGPLRLMEGTLVFPVVARVEDNGRPIGSLIRWQRLAGSEVISSGARLYLVNSNGSLWTNLNERVPALPIDPALLQRPSLPAAEIGRALVASSAVPGAPWTVLVEFPSNLIVGGPQRSIQRMILFGLLLLAAAGTVAWILSGRITGSIAELASAAQALSNGDYSRRASVTGGDEIGTLSMAFNTMAENVAEAHRLLEEKVAEVAASEQENRETRERMEHVISSSRAILYKYRIADREVVLDWVSDNVKRLLGYDVEAALKPGLWRRLRHPDDHDRFRAAQNRLEARGNATMEYRLRHADGQFRWVRDEQRLLRDNEGNPKEVVGVLSDVSEHRRLEGAKEAAEAANLAKSEFLSRMSHELRTPLNSVLGFGQLLQLDVESEENRESVGQILKAGQHLLSLIDEVLDIARIESGQMSLSVEPIFVADTVRESLDLVRLTAGQQGVTIRAEAALACEHYVRADQQRLKQVLLNLLSNAIKYNRREGTITLHCEELDDDRLRIVVADTGFGIPAAKMTRLFTPFERLDAEQAGVEGTGLGLALSRGLVEAMGGKLEVESAQGKGSRFWIDLPLAPRPEIVDPEPESTPVMAPVPVPEVTHTVLFIEDNLANVRLLERLFQRRPHLRLVTAMQGSLGLQLARERQPDLILLDLNLPDLPGDAVLRHIRHDPQLREIPVVMISGDAIPSQVQRLLDLGAQAYITKPFDIQELLRVVDENVGKVNG